MHFDYSKARPVSLAEPNTAFGLRLSSTRYAPECRQPYDERPPRDVWLQPHPRKPAWPTMRRMSDGSILTACRVDNVCHREKADPWPIANKRSRPPRLGAAEL